MRKFYSVLFSFLAFLLLMNGCALKTVNEMYRLPRRSDDANKLQSAIDIAMKDLEYASPVSGENQQTVQQTDLDGDGEQEYLVYAKSITENPLRILIFDRVDDHFQLMDTIEGSGSVFEQVEYVDFDDFPGKEIIVGKRVSDQMVRILSVYTYRSGNTEKLMSAEYHKFLTCKLHSSGETELFLIQQGEIDSDSGVAVLYNYRDGEVLRSQEAELSGLAADVKRIMISALDSGEAAVYVASAIGENAIITDVFTISEGRFTNVSLSNESGTSVQTLRNYYVYADDVDNDGVLELPDLITMKPLDQIRIANQQYLIRWYAMDIDGRERNKRYTFHNFAGGWYLTLNDRWANRITVSQEGNRYLFYLWDTDFDTCSLAMSVYAYTGTDRDALSRTDGRFVLYETEDVVYAAKLEPANSEIQYEEITSAFHLIQKDWKTGET